MYIFNNSISQERQQHLIMTQNRSVLGQSKPFSKQKKNNQPGMNRMKKEMAAMLPFLEKAEARLRANNK